jgi:hypothetical protein
MPTFFRDGGRQHVNASGCRSTLAGHQWAAAMLVDAPYKLTEENVPSACALAKGPSWL